MYFYMGKIFQTLCHSAQSISTFKTFFFFAPTMVNTRRRLHILIGAYIIKQLKAGCPGCEIQGKDYSTIII